MPGPSLADRIDQLSAIEAFSAPAGFAAQAQVRETRSGKIMRRLLRDIAEGREPGDVTTLRDTSVLHALRQATTLKGRTP
jgi:acyl-coenzyme A synthetase/AMP-(fatty) acid ligase